MAPYKTFAQRKLEAQEEQPGILIYDELPHPLRVQIIKILQKAIGEDTKYHNGFTNVYYNSSKSTYKWIMDTLCEEFGRFDLIQNIGGEPSELIPKFILEESDIDEVLSCIEISFHCIDLYVRANIQQFRDQTTIKCTPGDAISELNQRFAQHRIGYAYEGGQIIRVDSTLIHQVITKPTISLLSNSKFAGANQEYMKALEHWRHKRNKECLTHCGMAFESVLKSICTVKGWEYDSDRDTASDLLNICIAKGLIPTYIQNQFSSLKSLLSSGVPTIRNRRGAHGQGPQIVPTTDEITRYGLNLTASNIIFLIEQSEIK